MTFMDIIQKIRNSEADLTESERKVCRKILEDPSIVTMYTISQIAMMADTSTAAVLRFCQWLGCKGYKDFRYEVMNWLRANENKDGSRDIVTSVAAAYAAAIEELGGLDRASLKLLCDDILSSEKTVVLGRMRTSTAAEKLRMNLTGLGITALSGADTLAFQHLLYIINEKTAVIMFSTTGEITDQLEFLKQQKEQSQRIWLVTPARKAKMSAWADHTIVIPAVKSGTTFAGSQTVMMAFADILTALLEDISRAGE